MANVQSHTSADAIPAAFVASQVDALFSDARSFTVGSIGVVLAIGVVAVRTTSLTISCMCLGFAALTFARLSLMRRYALQDKFRWSRPQYESWERYYHIGATLHISAIGAFCLSTFLLTPSVPDRLIALSTVLTYMAGIPGRNFANAAGVDAQIVCGGVPIVAAIAANGPEYWLLILVVFIPFFYALRVLSGRLRGIFVQATTRANDLRTLAEQFDTALCNMSHGLAMFDNAGELVICNERLLELLALPKDRSYVGTTGTDMFMLALGDHSAGHIAKLAKNVSHPSTETVEINVGLFSALECSFQPMEKGGLVVLVQDITERKRSAARINQLALYDELTEIANKSHFRTYINRIIEQASGGEMFALMFIDLDRFKQVNDTLGHHRGDQLLVQVAQRLRRHLLGDMVARFGGDEFVVLSRIRDGVDEIARTANDIIGLISKPYVVDGQDVEIGTSIGIAVFPDHDSNADELLKKADMALYAAKAAGRGAFMLFEDDMDVRARAKSEMEMDLHRAIRNNELDLYFQPIFDLRLGRFTLCEALLRWKSPTRGFVSPADFIPIAEETGLIIEIGEWVLKRACQECARWPSDISVAVNISPLQFRRGDIVATVRDALQFAKLDARRLELELTESVLLQDVQHAMLTMTSLSMLGVRLSLDDFGTGYSSLNYLHKLPLNKVKIDRSFLAGLGSDRKTGLMLGGLARLIHELGLSVVIEGVETDEQLDLVTEAADISEVQGFLFSRPIPAPDAYRLLTSRNDSLTTMAS